VEKRSRRRSGKRPVLTSPWKIGAFVALQLVFVGIGVGYFFVSVYQVKLEWLRTGSSGWGIDSYVFFRQMYPLVAAVTLVSLVSYFLVASAVRRYKFYLDSGQDYRKMIALAESIDDLTNPAQIARLSSYPELQAILRNYGDSIREISQELGQREANVDYSEFDRELDSLLRGEPSDEAFAGKSWESTYRKIMDRIDSDRKRIEELQARDDGDRAVIGRAALAYGRVMEAISGAGEDLLEITKNVSELSGAAGEAGGAPAPVDEAGAQRKALKVIVLEMENSVRKLEEGGHVLHEFSEENNGVALNMALMAAKGIVQEQDLANFAERVRGTAERFRRLNGTIVSIAQGLLANCYAVKEKLGEATPSGRGQSPEVQRRILEKARMIEERSDLLQKRICTLGSELHEVHELLQTDFRVSGSPAAAGAPDGMPSSAESQPLAAAEPARAEAPPRGKSGARREESTFIIDHGKSWEGIDAEETGSPGPSVQERGTHSFEDEGEEVRGNTAAAGRAESTEEALNFSDMSSLRNLDEPEGAVAIPQTPPEAPQSDGGWMEMPGHRWLKINVEKSEIGTEASAVSVKVEDSAEPAAGRTGHGAPPVMKAANEMSASEAGVADDGERVYDLLELGAVEYVEETQSRR